MYIQQLIVCCDRSSCSFDVSLFILFEIFTQLAPHGNISGQLVKNKQSQQLQLQNADYTGTIAVHHTPLHIALLKALDIALSD